MEDLKMELHIFVLGHKTMAVYNYLLISMECHGILTEVKLHHPFSLDKILTTHKKVVLSTTLLQDRGYLTLSRLIIVALFIHN